MAARVELALAALGGLGIMVGIQVTGLVIRMVRLSRCKSAHVSPRLIPRVGTRSETARTRTENKRLVLGKVGKDLIPLRRTERIRRSRRALGQPTSNERIASGEFGNLGFSIAIPSAERSVDNVPTGLDRQSCLEQLDLKALQVARADFG